MQPGMQQAMQPGMSPGMGMMGMGGMGVGPFMASGPQMACEQGTRSSGEQAPTAAGGLRRRGSSRRFDDVESDDDADMSDQGGVELSDRSVRKKKKRPRQDDQEDLVPTGARYLGGRHIYGEKVVLAKVYKMKALGKCNVEEFNPLRLASLDEHTIDMLVFWATDCAPTVKISDLKTHKMKDIYKMLLLEHQRIQRTQPMRMKMVSPDYANLAAVVTSLGFPKKFLMDAPITTVDGSSQPGLPVVAFMPPGDLTATKAQGSPGSSVAQQACKQGGVAASEQTQMVAVKQEISESIEGMAANINEQQMQALRDQVRAQIMAESREELRAQIIKEEMSRHQAEAQQVRQQAALEEEQRKAAILREHVAKVIRAEVEAEERASIRQELREGFATEQEAQRKAALAAQQAGQELHPESQEGDAPEDQARGADDAGEAAGSHDDEDALQDAAEVAKLEAESGAAAISQASASLAPTVKTEEGLATGALGDTVDISTEAAAEAALLAGTDA